MFAHADIFHLSSNMYVLASEVPLLEGIFSTWFVVIFICVATYVSSASHFYFKSESAVGSSGAIYAVLAIVLLTFDSKEDFVQSLFELSILAMQDYLMGHGDNIAHFAHAGGFMFGIVTYTIMFHAWKNGK